MGLCCTKLETLIDESQWPQTLQCIERKPEEVEWCDVFGRYPIHNVCARDNVPVEVTECILEASPLLLKEKIKTDGRTPLHVAVIVGMYHMSTIRLIVKEYKEGAAVQDKEQDTPLHSHLLYCQEPNLEICQLLMQTQPHIIKSMNRQHYYPLHAAVFSGKVDWQIVKYILDLFPDALMKKNRKGQTVRQMTDNDEWKEKLEQEEQTLAFNKAQKKANMDESTDSPIVRKVPKKTSRRTSMLMDFEAAKELSSTDD